MTELKRQSKLSKVRPPRVRITYDVENGGTLEKRELPFVILILANLCGASPAAPYASRKAMEIDRDNFDDVMKRMAPAIDLAKWIENDAGLAAALPTPQDRIINIRSLADFEPAGLVSALPSLRAIGNNGSVNPQAPKINRSLETTVSKIMQCDAFSSLEATWRALHHLVMNAETGTLLKLQVMHAAKEELHDDLEKAVELDQSALFKLMYEAEYGTLGGVPCSMIVADFEVDGNEKDISLLRRIASVAAAAHAPLLCAASPRLLGLADFRQLEKVRQPSKIFESMELEAWREFRALEDARYVNVLLPHVLLREPCLAAACDSGAADETSKEGGQAAHTLNGGSPLWGNACYFLAERIAGAFSLYSWPAAIRGFSEMAPLEPLPNNASSCGEDRSVPVAPLDAEINAGDIRLFADQGLMALSRQEGTMQIAFFDALPASQSNEGLSRTLPYMLAASRFAHYVKVIMRDKVGSFLTRENIESYLNAWISNYVLLDDNATEEVKAAYPLRAASVVVTDVAGEPGSYQATLFLRPHFQLEELSTSIRLVAALPK